MRYHIEGIRISTGRAVKVRVEADSPEGAIQRALRHGVQVAPGHTPAPVESPPDPQASDDPRRTAKTPAPGTDEAGARQSPVPMSPSSTALHAEPRGPRLKGTTLALIVGGAALVVVCTTLWFLRSSLTRVSTERVASVTTDSHHDSPTGTRETVELPRQANLMEAQERATREAAAQAEAQRRAKLERERDATQVYWAALTTELGKLNDLPSDKQGESRVLRNLASNLYGLAALNVHPQALELGARWAKALRRVAEIDAYLSGGQWLLDCMKHGADGDPLWAIEEKKRLETEVLELVAGVQDSSSVVRQTLAQAYGVEFDPLP